MKNKLQINTCKKKKFQTEVEVMIIVADNRRKKSRGNEKRREIRYYHCASCNGWHLTSQIKNQKSSQRFLDAEQRAKNRAESLKKKAEREKK